MKINFSEIEPTSRERDSITGTLHGDDITVSRYLDGWRPMLEITINGQSLHRAEAEPEEREEFLKLEQRAFQAEMRLSDTVGAQIRKSKSFKTIFGL